MLATSKADQETSTAKISDALGAHRVGGVARQLVAGPSHVRQARHKIRGSKLC